MDESRLRPTTYRPYVDWWMYDSRVFIDERGSLSEVLPLRDSQNHFICLLAGDRQDFCVHGTSHAPNLNLYSADSTKYLPRYRYTKDGTRIDNITDWGLKQFRQAYGVNGVLDPARLAGGVTVDDSRTDLPSPLAGEGARRADEGSAATIADPSSVSALRADPPSPARGEGEPVVGAPARGEGKKGKRQLSKEDIFHYVYGVLHDPIYREKYALNLKREFPRIPFYADFWQWAGWGEALMALHIGYETVEPWPLKRVDVPDEKARAAGVAPKAMLKADKDNGIVRLDSETQLSGVPPEVWTYKLGNRSGVEWVLDQYKEKTPKDPTIREKFNTYRFADYKEKVIDLIGRVTRVSVETVAITEAMKAARR